MTILAHFYLFVNIVKHIQLQKVILRCCVSLLFQMCGKTSIIKEFPWGLEKWVFSGMRNLKQNEGRVNEEGMNLTAFSIQCTCAQSVV